MTVPEGLEVSLKTLSLRLTFELVLPTVALSVCACNTQQYRYLATDHAGEGLSSQRSEAFYIEPAKEPQEKVRVRSMGMVTLKPESEDKRIPALHIRMSVSGISSATSSWELRPTEERAVYPNNTQVPPLYVNTTAAAKTDIEIRPGSLQVVDFYFPLPTGEERAENLAEFDFAWTLHHGTDSIHETTHFERVTALPQPPEVYPYEPYPMGYGPVWYNSGPPVWAAPMPALPTIRVRQ